jgi:apolipoprotein N-acyltransferase
MKFSFSKAKLPTLKNSLLAFVSAILLVFAFPDFNLWFLAWFALVPLFFAIEKEKDSVVKTFVLGWIFGTVFFFGSCWWLSFAMITYGGIPTPFAYILVLIITTTVGLCFGVFGSLLSVLLKKFGSYAIFAAPFLWIAVEFVRYSVVFNNWNMIAYSQAFNESLIQSAQYGGIYLVGFLIVFLNAFFTFIFLPIQKTKIIYRLIPVLAVLIVGSTIYLSMGESSASNIPPNEDTSADVVAIQPDVPMSGLNYEKWKNLRERHVLLAEKGLKELSEQNNSESKKPLLVIFPESPMNYMYGEDDEFRAFINSFALKHNAYVLFNSAEPNIVKQNYFNSAILVNPKGEKIGQYDKIHLVPFGEYAPVPESLKEFIPTLVGSFELGKEYDLFPIGDAKAGILICYESHFPTLSREFVKDGADVLIEMTNDGYLGPTGVLKQHLASAVFRAVETNRPVLRTTNIGITAYITPKGEIQNPSESYTEDTRIWSISKSDGSKTFYVKYGDWFAWFCLIVSFGLLFAGFWRRKNSVANKL